MLLYVKATMPRLYFREHPRYGPSLLSGEAVLVSFASLSSASSADVPRTMPGVMAKDNTERETMPLQLRDLFSTHYSGIGVSTHGANQG